MAIITLTTDFGEKDHFVGAVKGAIYSELETVRIVDISHGVSPFNVAEAAYIIQNAYANFPKGSIHIIGIDSELGPENRHVALLLNGHYFICADNGILSLITSEVMPKKMVEINIHGHISSNFTVLDVFVKVATHIARGGKLEVIGKPIEELKPLKGLRPTISHQNNQIRGSVIYVDNYGNVVTNITHKLFENVGKGRSFEIIARNNKFRKIYDHYHESHNYELSPGNREKDGKKLALFNSAGYLELAIYKSNLSTVGGASSLFGLEFGSNVTVNFE